jgi:lipopolysaccharide export system protein LptA
LRNIPEILKIALFSGAFFLLCFQGNAQLNSLELLPGSEKLGYHKKLGYQYLVGGVNFRYQGNTMYCDSAHYYDKINVVRAYGNVHIIKDNINLFCDSLYYNGKTKKARLWGHVRVRDREYKLLTDSLEYNAKKGQATFRYGGRIESSISNEVLTSRVGYFYPDTKNFFFRGRVSYRNDDLSMTTDTLQYNYAKQITYFFGPTKILRDTTHLFCDRGWYHIPSEEGSLIGHAKILDGSRTIMGDTLLYQPQKGRSSGRGHVYFRDTLKNIWFQGDRAVNSDKDRYSFLTSSAWAVKIQKNDTVYIHADTLYNLSDSSGNTLLSKAFHGATLFHRSFQAICDSLNFDEANGKIELFKNPIVWSANAELKGDKIDLFLNDSIIEKAEIYENATVLMEVDSGKFYNQIAGKRITSHFLENELTRTDVSGNARTIFFPEMEEKTDTTVVIKRIGLNRLFASDLKIYLDSGEVTGITYFDEPDGIFFPMDQIDPDELFIPEFKWNPLLRPKNPRLMIFNH